MPILLLSSRFTDDSQSLWRAAVDFGWRVLRLQQWKLPEYLNAGDEPVLYVEGLAAYQVAAELGVALIEPPLDFLPRLPDRYRKRSVRLTTLAEARKANVPAFITPPNDKSFPARIYHADELPLDFPDDTPVLFSEVVTFQNEFRCFISDRTLRTYSLYARNGEIPEPGHFDTTVEENRELFRFVNNLLDDPEVELPVAVALDVGITVEYGWAVVEANAAWGAGIYGCDPKAVLQVLQMAVRRE